MTTWASPISRISRSSLLADSHTVQVGPPAAARPDAYPIDFCALGLMGVVEQLTTPLRADGVAVVVDCKSTESDIDRHTAVLAYRAAAVLLRNVHHQQPGRQVRVTLGCEDSWLHLTVRDTGPEPDAAATLGGGPFARLRTLVDEAHGHLEVSFTPNGCTEVLVALPTNRP